jgi:hypothetical protein
MAAMSEQENPNHPTLELLRQAIELHCRQHVALGPDDAREWFHALAGKAWKESAAGQWDLYVKEREQRIRDYRKTRA